tara:strand:- start:5058 stop:5663 length:606 start_codon:yes stop_codon:yes gene_type:complete
MLNYFIGYCILSTALVATLIIVTKSLKNMPARKVWVRHCAPVSDIDSIVTNGFNKPWCEELLINVHEMDVERLGQKGADRVSFSMYKDQPYWNMRKGLAEVNGTPKDLAYFYVKVPVCPADTFLSDAVLVLSDGTEINYGQGVEINIDRDVVNAAIRKGEYRRTEPSDYRSFYQKVLTIACTIITLHDNCRKAINNKSAKA